MKEKVKAHAALLVSGLIFGINYWVAKGLMPEPLLPRQIIFIRVFLAAVLFWVISQFTVKEKVQTKHLVLIALSSFLGVAMNQIFFFEGLNLTTPVDAAILHSSSPIVVLIFAALVIRERVSWINLAGVMLGAAGAVLLIIADKNPEVFRGNILGNIFIMINLSSYAMYLVLIKPMMKEYNLFTVMKWVFFFGFIAVMPFTTHTMLSLSHEVLNYKTIVSLAYIVLGTSMLAYLLTVYGLKYLKASSAGYYIYLQPLLAAMIGLFWFNEAITLQKVISAVLIFAGVYFVNFRNHSPG